MDEMDYPVSANISEIEWIVVQEMRKVKANKYGGISIVVHDGIVKEVTTSFNQKKTELDRLQT